MPFGQPPTPRPHAASSMFWARARRRSDRPLAGDRDGDDQPRAADVPGLEDGLGQPLPPLGALDDEEAPRLPVLGAPGEPARVEDLQLDLVRNRPVVVAPNLAPGRDAEPQLHGRSLVRARKRAEDDAEERVHGRLVGEDAARS